MRAGAGNSRVPDRSRGSRQSRSLHVPRASHHRRLALDALEGTAQGFHSAGAGLLDAEGQGASPSSVRDVAAREQPDRGSILLPRCLEPVRSCAVRRVSAHPRFPWRCHPDGPSTLCSECLSTLPTNGKRRRGHAGSVRLASRRLLLAGNVGRQAGRPGNRGGRAAWSDRPTGNPVRALRAGSTSGAAAPPISGKASFDGRRKPLLQPVAALILGWRDALVEAGLDRRPSHPRR